MHALFMSRHVNIPVLALLTIWATEPAVHAYIDPGSGALIWQAIVAGFVGAAFYFRRFFERLFSRGRREQPPSDRGR
jgi:hypothetical protein